MTRTMSQALLSEFESLDERTGLIPCLFVLRRRIRVDDDARARLYVRAPVRHDDRANGDAEVQVAGEVQISDGACVESAPRGLELLDDLHRTDLRRTGDRAGREARHQRIEPIAIVSQLAFDDRRQVHDMREPLETHELRYAHR